MGFLSGFDCNLVELSLIPGHEKSVKKVSVNGINTFCPMGRDVERMACKPRIEFPGTIYRVMNCGARREIIDNDSDAQPNRSL